jgi:hypothetical protein
MRHYSFKIVCLVLWTFVLVLSGYSDELTINYESRVLEAFNGDSDYTWKTEASKFSTKTDDISYPVIAYVNAYPMAAFGVNPEGGENIKSLGIHGRFDRPGYNWMDIYPTDSDGNPAEIPVPGRVRSIDMWVWGANLKCYIEIFLRDYQGVVHVLKLGDISYPGWKNLRVNVPNIIPQSKRILPSYAGLSFIKFRIWTMPTEGVNNLFIYFKQLKVLTDTYEALFDGNSLADPQQVEKLWAAE